MMPDGVDLRLGHWRTALADVEMVDAIITDPPYSQQTHAATASAVRRDPSCMPNPKKIPPQIPYACWSDEEAASFVRELAPRCRGWFVVITSHDLARIFEAEMKAAGRYVFAPVAWVAPGSRVRLVGDGPSNWSCWIVVSRPRCEPYSRWGTLPGAYVIGNHDSKIVGGKPIQLMRNLVRDYSRPGDLVCDPCCGAGTTALACALESRRCVTSELDPATYALAKRRLEAGFTPQLPGFAA